jgi:hypothetical protein
MALTIKKPAVGKPSLKIRVYLVITRDNEGILVPALKRASQQARYTGSPYHRLAGSAMGRPQERRWPLASKCPNKWDFPSATRALRDAIQAASVCDWDGKDFPQRVWYQEEERLYEARITNGTLGEYHAYPLDDRREWPKKH